LSEICPLRPVPCPFADIGCSASLLYKDVPAHLDQCAPAHLILAIDRVREQGVVIEKLFGRIYELEQHCNDNSARINGLAAASAAAVVAIEVAEKRMWSKCSDEIGRAERFVLLAPICLPFGPAGPLSISSASLPPVVAMTRLRKFPVWQMRLRPPRKTSRGSSSLSSRAAGGS
jgi:hypothetical protein